MVILTRDVYANGHQFATVQELKLQIERSWYSLKPEFLQNLVLSMFDRDFQGKMAQKFEC